MNHRDNRKPDNQPVTAVAIPLELCAYMWQRTLHNGGDDCDTAPVLLACSPRPYMSNACITISRNPPTEMCARLLFWYS